MSCFMLDKNAIDQCVLVFMPRFKRDSSRPGWMILSGGEYNDTWHTEPTNRDRTKLGRLLWKMNLESCKVRYPNDESGQRPGPIGFTDDEVEDYIFMYPRGDHFKTCFTQVSSLMYQSSEAPWEETGWGKETYDLVEKAWGWVATSTLTDEYRAEEEKMIRQLRGQA